MDFGVKKIFIYKTQQNTNNKLAKQINKKKLKK